MSFTESEIAAKVEQLDPQVVADIEAAENAKLTTEIWDRVSAVNGCPAATLLAREDVHPDGVVYLVKDASTGRVLFFQPHEPRVQGLVWMDSVSAPVKAAEHKAELAELMAAAAVRAAAIEALTAERAAIGTP